MLSSAVTDVLSPFISVQYYGIIHTNEQSCFKTSLSICQRKKKNDFEIKYSEVLRLSTPKRQILILLTSKAVV